MPERPSGMLAVDPRHTLYWEQSGNPQGAPVIFLHGGPGAGVNADQRRFFDPAHYRIIRFEQRRPVGRPMCVVVGEVVAEPRLFSARLSRRPSADGFRAELSATATLEELRRILTTDPAMIFDENGIVLPVHQMPPNRQSGRRHIGSGSAHEKYCDDLIGRDAMEWPHWMQGAVIAWGMFVLYALWGIGQTLRQINRNLARAIIRILPSDDD
jgi:hypothetical protein